MLLGECLWCKRCFLLDSLRNQVWELQEKVDSLWNICDPMHNVPSSIMGEGQPEKALENGPLWNMEAGILLPVEMNSTSSGPAAVQLENG